MKHLSISVLLFGAALLFVAPLGAQVTITKGENRVSVAIDQKPFTELIYGPNTTKPYLNPLRSASGKRVTRGFPMENIEGETKDHPHHQGLWFNHGDVNGLDFWGALPDKPTPKSGRIVLTKIDKIENGKKSGQLWATFEWRDPSGKALLREARKMTFYAEPSTRTVDFDITLTALEKVKFGDTKEGSFAIRLCAQLEEPMERSPKTPARTGKMVNAEGLEGEKNVWGTRSNWVDYFGMVDGEKLGVAIFDNPGNPRHPAYWHSRSYGLFAVNIFGEHDFLRDKTKDSSLTLEPGQTLRLRYRVLIHPGDVHSADIAGRYAAYAAGK